MLGKRSAAFSTQERDMLRPWTAAIFLLSTPVWASEQQPPVKDNSDISGLLEGKRPCDGEKTKDEVPTPPADAQKTEAALEGLIGAEKKPEPAPKSLGAVPPMGHCK
jgi:hypothetical protein